MKVSARLLRGGGLDFSNTREAYRSKTFGELFRHYLVYKVFSYTSVVENSQRVSCMELARAAIKCPLSRWAHTQNPNLHNLYNIITKKLSYIIINAWLQDYCNQAL